MFFDPIYLLFLAPALLLSFIASMMVKSRFAWASKILSPRGLTGAQVARMIADHHGLQAVPVLESGGGHLSDHYDPRKKELRLSPEVYEGRSMAAYGVAAHEVGHAIQDETRYGPLVIRNAIVPLANFGGNAAMFIFMGGLALSYVMRGSAGTSLGEWLMIGGIVLFSTVVLFQFVNLVAEFDASNRAKVALIQMGVISEQELPAVKKVLGAAALTYVAGTLSAVLTLAYLVFRFAGARRD